jgi:hypothetical protein
MVTTLCKFEEAFPDIAEERDGERFKSTIRTIFNEAIRANANELADYEVDFRPLRVTDEAVTMTRTFMETVERIEFTEVPGIKIYASAEKRKVLDAIRSELDGGIVYEYKEGLVLHIAGLEDCISVIPAFDLYRMLGPVKARYTEWRRRVVGMYTEE